MAVVDGGPAFPFHRTVGAPPEGGMTLRDWFAGRAMSGLIADDDWSVFEPVAQSNLAETAYEFADAMLAARSKEA